MSVMIPVTQSVLASTISDILGTAGGFPLPVWFVGSQYMLDGSNSSDDDHELLYLHTGVDTTAPVTPADLELPDLESRYVASVTANEPPWYGSRVVTNNLLYSEDFNQSAWVKSGDFTFDQPDPLGGNTAVRIQASISARYMFQDVVITTGGTITLFCWVYVAVASSTSSLNIRDVAAGVTLGSIPLNSLPTGEWTKISTTAQLAATSTGGRFQVSGIGTTDDVYIAFAQHEDVTGQTNKAPSSYIPTTTAAVTKRYSNTNRNVVDPVTGIVTEGLYPNDRIVENLLTYTEDFSNADWALIDATKTVGVTDPDGGTSAVTVTATAANGRMYNALTPYPSKLVTSGWIRRRTGAGAIQMWTNNGAYVTLAVTSEWQRFSAVSDAPSGFYYMIRCAVSGDAYDLWHPQLEGVVGQTNQNPSEYVPTTTVAASESFSTLNGNTVLDNIVTEATGDPIKSKTRSERNELSNSEDYDNSSYWSLNNCTFDPVTKYVTSTAQYGNTNPTGLNIITAEVGDVYVYSILLKSISGAKTARIAKAGTSVISEPLNVNITLSDTGVVRYARTLTVTTAGALYIRCQLNDPSEQVVYQAGVQMEIVTHKANQNPSEYIQTGSAPVGQTYNYSKGNTVLDNVVTEARGATYPAYTRYDYPITSPIRKVVNVVPNSVSLDGWNETKCTTKSVLDVRGGYNAVRVTATDVNAIFFTNIDDDVPAGHYTAGAAWIRRVSGTGVVKLLTATGGILDITSRLTTSWRRFSSSQLNTLGISQAGVWIDTSGDVVDYCFPQVEDTTLNPDTTIPSEYVPTGDSPAGQLFTWGNPNTVVDNVVIEPDEPVPELVTNGDFAYDGDWTKGTGWSISDGKAHCSGAQTGNSLIFQGGITKDSSIYKVTFTVSNYSAGSVAPAFENSVLGTSRSANGTYTEYITSAVTVLGNTYLLADSAFIGSIDNVSVTAQYPENMPSLYGNGEATNVIPYSDMSSGWTETAGTENDLVTNGDFATDLSSWTPGTGWAWGAAGVAHCDGTQTANSDLTQSAAITAGKIYKMVFTISNYSTGTARPIMGNGIVGGSYTANGTYTEYIVATGTAIIGMRALSTFIGDIDDVAVYEAVAQPNSETGLDGTLSACKLTDDDTVTYESVKEEALAIPNDSNPVTARFWVTKDEDETRFAEFQLQIYGGTGLIKIQHLNTKTGELTGRGAQPSGSDAQATLIDGRWELLLSLTNNGTNPFCNILVAPAMTDTAGSLAVTATGSIIVADPVELHIDKTIEEVAGSAPIKTSGASVTVPAIQMPYDILNHSDEQGAYYCEWRTIGGIAIESNNSVIGMNLSNRLLYTRGDSLRFQDDTSARLTNFTIVEGEFNKFSGAYGDGQIGVNADGQAWVEGAYSGSFSLNAFSVFENIPSPTLIRNIRRYDVAYANAKEVIDELMES